MSTTEALRTQLDAVNTQLYALEAENRRQREERPELAERIHVEEELKQTREENVNLAQQISELEEETSTLKLQCVERQEKLEETKRRCSEQQGELESEREARKELIARVEEAEEAAYRLRNEAELEKFRALAEETRKWEEREARWMKRIEELDSNRRGETGSRSSPTFTADVTAKSDGGSATQTYVIGTGNGSRTLRGPGERAVSFNTLSAGGVYIRSRAPSPSPREAYIYARESPAFSHSPFVAVVFKRRICSVSCF